MTLVLLAALLDRRARHRLAVVALSFTLLAGDAALAAEKAGPPPLPAPGDVWESLVKGGSWGKVTLDMRLRMELAEQVGLEESQAYTLRTRLGYRTPTWQGFSAFIEGENVLTFDHGGYYDGTGSPNGKTPITDPPDTDLNQGFLRYDHVASRSSVIGGRQRITLDDQRFIGNVGWRQNEQTFDAGLVQSGLGVRDLNLLYAYIGHVNRIFGDKEDGPPTTRDFDCHCNVLNGQYTLAPWLSATAFAYLLDFTTPAAFGFSSNSYGFRATGQHGLGGDWSAGYALSYAYQTEAGHNPVDYGANYVGADGSLAFSPLGRVGVGYELLGSDGGRARFVTPLATLHAFNGWADVFLDNGGPNGLQDLYVYTAPALPFEFTARLVYHRFWNDHGGLHLGDEFDGVLSRPLSPNVTVLTEGAWFDGAPGSGRAGIWRFWLEATLKF